MNRAVLILVFTWCSFLLNAQKEWMTFYEQSGGKRTPRYHETMDYCQKLAEASDLVHLTSFGTSPQGRKLPLLIVDRDGLQDPEAIKSAGRLILLIQACIHPGESEGKDAGMMLIRDLIMRDEGRRTRNEELSGIRHPASGGLLENVSILFIPIFNVDGHERFGPYNRINQNGPEEMGWRVTATNLNLNRDFLKADAPEMQAWLKFYNRWLPDFFIDIHTTDGADYQYVLTYMMETLGQMDPGLTKWCDEVFLPEWTGKLNATGYPVFPYVRFRRWHDPKSGLIRDVAPPMLSQGYVALRNRPGLLIETHMLKPYNQRVEATYECLVYALEILNRQAKKLQSLLIRADDYVQSHEFQNASFPLQFETSLSDSSFVNFKGVEYEEIRSDLTGGVWFKYSSTPATFHLPVFSRAIPTETVKLPLSYIIPAEWSVVVERLNLHGIRMNRLEKDSVITVTSYKIKNPRWRPGPYEGRHRLSRINYDTYEENRFFPAGSVIIETAQPAARVIAQLLEPKGDGSLLSWGFFDPVFEQKEYAEYYVLEPLAKQMLEKDPELKREFEQKLASDSTFAKSQRRILYWFFEHTPYWDQKRFVYPVARIEQR